MVSLSEFGNVIFTALFGRSVLLLLVGVVLLIGLAVAVYFFVEWYRWNLKIEFWDNIDGKSWSRIARRKARRIKYSQSGEQIIVTRRGKLYLPINCLPIAKNTYEFYKGRDGLYYNVIPEDFDKSLGRRINKVVDPRMREWNVAIRKSNDRNYGEKSSFLQKYGAIIGFIIFVFVIGVMFYLLFDKFVVISNTLNTALESQKELTELNKELVAGLIELEGGSGLSAAPV